MEYDTLINKKNMELLKNGDQEVLESIYFYYKDSLYFFILKQVQNTADAEEVLQDTFIKAINNIDSLKNEKAFQAWLYTIAYRQAMDVHRKKTRSAQTLCEDVFENVVVDDQNIVDELHKKDLYQLLEQEIKAMPQNLQEITYLRFFCDLQIKEISNILEIPEGTIKSRLSKARGIMKPVFLKHGYSTMKHYSLVATPILYQVFQTMIKQESLSNDVDTLNNIKAGQEVVAATGTLGFLSNLSLTSKTTLIVLGSIVGGVGGYQLYETTQPKVFEIQEISYYTKPTNKELEVQVKSNQQLSKEDVFIVQDDNVIEATIKDNGFVFYAQSNGEYYIKVKDKEKNIHITNINKEAPTLQAASYSNQTLQLKLGSHKTPLDYAKSKAVYNKQEYAIQKDGTIQGDFQGIIELVLYDELGNQSTYEVDIHDI